MSRATFSVSQEIVTPESAQDGDAESRDMLADSVSLREAITLVRQTRTAHVDGIESIECDSSPYVRPRWVTVTNSQEYRTGAQESRTLHINQHITDASARRVARLVKEWRK